MILKRMWALFTARNLEFIRDRAGFGWNILFPFLLVAAFSIAFWTGCRKTFQNRRVSGGGSGAKP